jgi:hypothetical protein
VEQETFFREPDARYFRHLADAVLMEQNLSKAILFLPHYRSCRFTVGYGRKPQTGDNHLKRKHDTRIEKYCGDVCFLDESDYNYNSYCDI